MSHQDAQAFLAELPEVKNDLPFSPALLHDLFLQTEQGSICSIEDIARTISGDQGLAARVLRLANSAFYGLQSEVGTVSRAATVLGLREIRNMVLALGVRGLSERRALPEGFDLRAYWMHQLQVAVAARRLAQMTGSERSEVLFTAGLLHDLGKLVCALYRPDHWRAMCELADTGDLEDVEAEEAHWGLDHAIVGGLLLKTWTLPADLVEPVNWHHAPELAGESDQEAGILALADVFAHYWADKEKGDESPWTERLHALLDEFELDFEVVEEEVGDALEDESMDAFAAMLT